VRVGFGFDVHALVSGRHLILGGVNIPHTRGLEGHSDGDVALHAIADALLGATGLGDIGTHFPSSDPSIKGISSLDLLRRSASILDDALWQIENVDVTIVTECPVLAPHISRMRQHVADALSINVTQVNVKATTTDGLGFTGRNEGIAAYAIASVKEATP
jgi:2-C-methyl-D-erythritol 2,4-cyclodiphosphate synthase